MVALELTRTGTDRRNIRVGNDGRGRSAAARSALLARARPLLPDGDPDAAVEELDQARSLNNIASASVHSGDPGGVHDLEQSVALAERIKDIPELIRAHNNLGVMHLVLGNRPGWEAGILEAHRLALHFGHQGFARWSEGARPARQLPPRRLGRGAERRRRASRR